MMRIVIGTPRSARTSASSSSSQSIGLPENCLASDSRKFILSAAAAPLCEAWGLKVLPHLHSVARRAAATILFSPLHGRGDPNLFGYDREYRSQIVLNPRHRTPSPARSPR